MPLAPGQTLSFYEILGILGAGGMGEVYRARDTRLEREVAIKVLPEELADDGQRLRRFEREARTLASLNHPNVAGIHGIDMEGDTWFIVMELVPGEDLAERLSRGALGLHEAVGVCKQIAEGLEAAHASGVVHRDLKPANVRITPEGRVKLLDFGLAKGVEEQTSSIAGTASILATRTGMAMGTPPYMSPEQARGKEVTHATDVWAFGCVLYECLTGRRAFDGDSTVDVLSAIVTRDPDWQALPPETPHNLREVLRRAFVKEPDKRELSIAELKSEITSALDVRAIAEAAAPPRTPFVGRIAEQQQVVEMIESAARGRGGLVLLGGEPGVGKTRLAEELLEAGRQRGMLPLQGHAYEEDSTPFITSVEILEEMIRLIPEGNLREMMGPNASELARLMPGLRRRFPDIPEPEDLPAEQQQRYLFNSILEFCERASRSAPLIMLLDDMHWADESSLLLLEHLAPHLAELPMFMVGTYRDVELEVGKPFAKTRANLVRRNLARRISIRRFGEQEVTELIAALARQDPPDDLTDAIYRETEGNPFFVTEVFEHLAEEGLLFESDGRWRTDLDVAELDVPEGVRLVIGRRLERLDPGTPKVLATAATIGLRFDLAVLEHASGDPDAVLDALEEAEAARLVAPVPGRRNARYEFVHALVRQTLLHTLSVPRRQRLHLRVAEAMEQAYRKHLKERAGDLAHHFYQSGAAADPQKTRRYLGMAARQSLDAAAADKALILVDRALEEDEDIADSERAWLLYLRGLAHRTLGSWERAFEEWQPAVPILEAEGSAEIVAEICDSIMLQLAWKHEMEQAREWLERGLRAVGEEPGTWRCRLLSSLGAVVAATGDYDGADRVNTEAIDLAEELGDDKALACAFWGRLYQAHHFLRPKMQIETGDRAIEAARRAGSGWELCGAIAGALRGYLSNGQRERFENLAAELLPMSVRHGHRGAESHVLHDTPTLHILQGDLPAARAALETCIERFREYENHWTSNAIAYAGLVDMWRGDRERSMQTLEDSLHHEVIGTHKGLERAYRLLARAVFGDPDAAALLQEQSVLLPTPGIQNPVGRWLTGLTTIEAAAILDRPEVAAALYPCTTQLIADGCVFPWGLGMTEKFAGISASCGEQWTLAERHFEEALRQAEALGHRIEQPEIRRWHAHMLLRRDGEGDRARARTLLASARAAYREIGMPWHVALAEKALGVAG